MRAVIRRWGNSLALRIPKAFADELGIEDGGEVELAIEEGRLSVAPAGPALRLEDLLARVTARNRHGEADLGPPTGREAW